MRTLEEIEKDRQILHAARSTPWQEISTEYLAAVKATILRSEQDFDDLLAEVKALSKAQEIVEATCRSAQEENAALRDLLKELVVYEYENLDGIIMYSVLGVVVEAHTPDAAIDAAIEAVRKETP
jgi:hypothetical protein